MKLAKADFQRLCKQMYNMGTAADVVIIHLPPFPDKQAFAWHEAMTNMKWVPYKSPFTIVSDAQALTAYNLH